MVKATFAVELNSGQLAELMATLAGLGVMVSMKMAPVDGAQAPADDAEAPMATQPEKKAKQPAKGREFRRVNKECQMCGLGFVAQSNGAKYCPSCKDLQLNARKRGRTQEEQAAQDEANHVLD